MVKVRTDLERTICWRCRLAVVFNQEKDAFNLTDKTVSQFVISLLMIFAPTKVLDAPMESSTLPPELGE